MSASLDGVSSRAGSDEGAPVDDGGDAGVSTAGSVATNGGGKPGSSSSSITTGSAFGVISGSAMGSSTGKAGAGAAFGRATGGSGFLNMLAQLRVPSGFELGLAGSAITGRISSPGATISHEEASGDLALG